MLLSLEDRYQLHMNPKNNDSWFQRTISSWDVIITIEPKVEIDASRAVRI